MLSDIVGKKKLRLEFDGTNVNNVLDELVRRYGMKAHAILYDSKGSFNPDIQVVINGKEWVPTYKHSETFLREGDTLSFVILLPGG
jgi:molybdopterin converting factor small subunit